MPATELAAVFGDTTAADAGGLTVEALPHAAVASATAGLWRVRVGDRSAVVKVLAHAAGLASSGDRRLVPRPARRRALGRAQEARALAAQAQGAQG